MADDPRAALDQFIASLERHLAAASHRRSELDPAVVEAYDTLAAAFERYDEALFTAYDEVTPFVLSEEEDDEYEDDDDLDDEVDDLEDADEPDPDAGDVPDRGSVVAGSARERHGA
ncbi:MAG: primosomal protein [Kineosporiaceae bacterium]